ncbi:MAG: ComEC/Rec2 family competence protein, partial [Tsuneonella sp.]
MATRTAPSVLLGEGEHLADAAVQRPWRNAARLSSMGNVAEGFLARAGFDRAPWLTIALGSGIVLWFALATPWQWCSAIGLALLAAIAAGAGWRGRDDRWRLRVAVVGISLALALGTTIIWARSATVGEAAIDRPAAVWLDARVLQREEQPA